MGDLGRRFPRVGSPWQLGSYLQQVVQLTYAVFVCT